MAQGLKATNPKDVVASNKLPLHLWPATATAMGSIGMLNGMLKYGRTNWRESGVLLSVYIDALNRHTSRWFEGEEVDPDDGVPHPAAILACVAIIVDARAQGMLIDDRQYKGPDGYVQLLNELTPHVGRLKALHANEHPVQYSALLSTDGSSRTQGCGNPDGCARTVERSKEMDKRRGRGKRRRKSR